MRTLAAAPVAPPQGFFFMDRDQALESLETIRKILERSTTFTHIAPVSLFLGGGAASAAAIASWGLGWEPGGTPVQFLALWGMAFIIALAAGLGTSARRARQLGEVFWSRKLQFVLYGFLPALAASAVLTALFLQIGRVDLCPGIWMMLYGVGILSAGMVLDWEFRAAAWGFLVAGTITIFIFREAPSMALGAAFGGGHLALGVFRLIREGQSTWSARRQELRSTRT
jgi:hypothetical protein